MTTVASKKLVQIFISHRKQLKFATVASMICNYKLSGWVIASVGQHFASATATRFISSFLLEIDGTFKTNLRLLLLVLVGVMNSGSTVLAPISKGCSYNRESHLRSKYNLPV